MNYLKLISNGLFREEDGVTATEYAVMLAVIVLVCVVSIGLLGESVKQTFEFITSQL